MTEPIARRTRKRCPTCGRDLPIEQFHRARSRADGHFAICKSCNIAKVRAHYRRRLANPIEPPAAKRCPRCHETKPAAAYASDRGSPSGLQTYCRACHAELYRELKARRAADIRR